MHTVVIESVETYLERRIVDFSIDKAENYLQKTGSNPIESNNVNNNDPNSWSLLRVRDYFYYRLFKNESPICIEKLNNDYFSCDKPEELFFYRHNITCGVSIRKNNEVCVRHFFNLLCEKAKEKGVSLILLIAVDKYDLYQSYIIDNEWPTKTVMEDVNRIIGEDSRLLLSKNILKPMLENGEKDIFKFNDTHWSYKASQIIADELYNRIVSK